MWTCTLVVLLDGTECGTFYGVADDPASARADALQGVAAWMLEEDNFDAFTIVSESYA